MRRLRQLARDTPAGRERYVDLLRAIAITLVVLGHWLIIVIERDPDGKLTGHSALPDLPWAQPLTWLVQVIPLFFLVGGYANAASLTSAATRGEGAVDWLRKRGDRLVRPTAVLLLVLVGAALAAHLLGVPPTRVRTVVWFATIPLWFLSAYLLVVLLAPVTYPLHRRYGPLVPAALVVLVALGDVARLHGPAVLAAGNYLFGWLVIHQLGYAWRDGHSGAHAHRPADPAGRPRTADRAGWLRTDPRTGLLLAVGGLTALVLLTRFGPYPVSMIDVPGQLRNTSPPTVALLAVAALQLGLALLLAGPGRRWLRRERPWQAVIAVNSVVLTIFLWHVTAAVVVTGALDAVGLLPTAEVGTAAWWLWRVPWLLALSVVLAVLVAVVGPVEIRSGRRRAHPSAEPVPPGRRAGWRLPVTVLGYAGTVLGLLDNNLTSKSASEPLGVPVTALVAFLAGLVLIHLPAVVRTDRRDTRRAGSGRPGGPPGD